MGDGTGGIKTTPIKTLNLNGITKISTGFSHSLALKQDGTLWVWGHNAGAYGNGTQNTSLLPIKSTVFTDITDISGGEDYTVLLRKDGSVWSTGYNGDGQLGDGSSAVQRLSPVKVVFEDLSNTPPTVAFTITPTSGEAPLTIHLDAEDSSDNGSISQYAWSSSTGQNVFGQKVSLTMSTVGTHTVTLTLTDDQGKTASLSKTVNVTVSPVTAYCSNVTDIPQAECETLVALNESLLAKWNRYQIKDSKESPCDWLGLTEWERVTCRNGHVVAIKLSWMGDGGTLPDLSALTHLEELVLNMMKITGSIPNLSTLRKLRVLSLYRNELTGSIPTLVGMVNLEDVILDENQLTGSIPDLTHLPNLKRFRVWKNQLTGSIPNLIDLPKLESLVLKENQLTGTIPNLDGLTKLQTFDLSANQFTGNIPDLTDLINLQRLALDGNQLTGMIPDLTTLVNLESFSLAHNQLNGPIPPELGTLTNLRHLYLSHNQLIGTIPNLMLLSHLDAFQVDHNQLTGPLPEFGFSEYLFFIGVQNNQLCGEIPSSLLEQIYAQQKRGGRTYVNNNHLTTSDPDIIAFLDEEDPGWAATQTQGNCANTSTLTVTKTGMGRGTIAAKIKSQQTRNACGADCEQGSYSYKAGSEIVITARPAEGFVFGGWTGDCNGMEPRLITTVESEDITCTAQFEPSEKLQKLTVEATGGGKVTSSFIDCGEQCEAYYPSGANIRLNAIPDTGHSFIKWSDSCGSTEPTKPTLKTSISVDTICMAEFAPNVELKLMVVGEGAIKNTTGIDCGTDCYAYPPNTSVKLRAIPDTNSSFNNWAGDCDGIERTTTIVMDTSKTCSANFIATGTDGDLNDFDEVAQTISSLFYESHPDMDHYPHFIEASKLVLPVLMILGEQYPKWPNEFMERGYISGEYTESIHVVPNGYVEILFRDSTIPSIRIYYENSPNSNSEEFIIFSRQDFSL